MVKIKLRNSEGTIGIVIIFVVILLLGVMLTGGFVSPVKNLTQFNNNNNKEYIPVIPTLANGKETLQLRKIDFIEPTSPPFKPTTECGNKKIAGTSESEILWAVSPDPGGSVGPGGTIKAFYHDEWALTLGSGNVTAQGKAPGHIISPNINFGNESARDANGFPYFPALFITDITSDPNNKTGDAQSGGTPYKPDEIYGTWQPLNKKNNSRNGTNLGGPDSFPSKSNVVNGNSQINNNYNLGYTSEIIWKVDNLGLTTGHVYRAQFIIHDGDREGDIGQGCSVIRY